MMPKVVTDDHVFKVVMQTLIERGYDGATTRQMADTAGISEVTLFRKYGSKVQLVQRAIAAVIEQAHFMEATQYTGYVQEDLLDVLQAYQAVMAVHRQFFAVIFVELARNAELRQAVEQPLELFTALSSLITRYQRMGQLREEHPLHVVAALLGPLIYTMMVRQMGADQFIPPIELPQYVQFFLEGHGVKGNSLLLEEDLQRQ